MAAGIIVFCLKFVDSVNFPEATTYQYSRIVELNFLLLVFIVMQDFFMNIPNAFLLKSASPTALCFL